MGIRIALKVGEVYAEMAGGLVDEDFGCDTRPRSVVGRSFIFKNRPELPKAD